MILMIMIIPFGVNFKQAVGALHLIRGIGSFCKGRRVALAYDVAYKFTDRHFSVLLSQLQRNL